MKVIFQNQQIKTKNMALIYSLACPEMVVIGYTQDGDNAVLNLSNKEKDAMLFDTDQHALEFLEIMNISVEFYGTRPPRRPK